MQITKDNIISILDDIIAEAEVKTKGFMHSDSYRRGMEFWMNTYSSLLYNQAVQESVPFKGDTGFMPPYKGFNIVVDDRVKSDSILFTYKGRHTADEVIENHYRMSED